MSAALYDDYGIWVSAVLYPAVAIGTSILRAIPTAAHTPADVQTFLKALRSLKESHHCNSDEDRPAD